MSNYSDTITRELSDFHHWGHMGMAGVEYTVTYTYTDAEPEVLHFRITQIDGVWYSLGLLTAHGEVKQGGLDRIEIDPAVISRIRSIPGTFAQAAPTRKFVEAFYGMH